MRTDKTTKSNANEVSASSFKEILKQMMKLTSSGTLRVVNWHWSIYEANNINYNNIAGA